QDPTRLERANARGSRDLLEQGGLADELAGCDRAEDDLAPLVVGLAHLESARHDDEQVVARLALDDQAITGGQIAEEARLRQLAELRLRKAREDGCGPEELDRLEWRATWHPDRSPRSAAASPAPPHPSSMPPSP